MDPSDLYDLVQDATRTALRDELRPDDVPMLKRMFGGRVLFEDNQGRTVKELDVSTLFKKVTSVREKLRVLEQKLNNHGSLDGADKAELQVYITRCYGSLTTFNFLFQEEHDKFRGSNN